MPETWHAWIGWVQTVDPWLHAAVGLSGAAGVGFSLAAIAHTWRQGQALRQMHINGLRQSVVRSHLVMHGGILICQVALVAVGAAMLTLPPIPPEMLAGEPGARILAVLLMRKAARLLTGLTLLGISAYKVRWLRRVFGDER